MAPQRTITLSTGAPFPTLGFGTYDAEPGKTYPAVLKALETGYRHLDCAWAYKNEKEVGEAIRDFLKASEGKVKREDLFVTTKLWNHLHAPEDVEWAIEESLRNLGLEYVDLYLIHWPVAAEKESQAEEKKQSNGDYILNAPLTADDTPTWRAMEALHRAGKAHAIGVSNYNIPRLQHLLSIASTPPAVNQVEIHPFLPNTALLSFCSAHNIHLAGYSPLGGQGAGTNKLLQNEKLVAMAKERGCTVAQLLIGWGIERGYAVLPKSFTPERIESNFELVELGESGMQAVEEAVGGTVERFCGPVMWGVDVWADGE